MEDLEKFVALLDTKLQRDSDFYRGYVMGYSFKDLTGEFDLLRFTKTHIIEIELKSRDATENDLENQLKKKQILFREY